MTDKQPDTDPYRLYFQLPEDRVDLTKLKMVCLQLSDGTELWFENQRVAVGLLKRLGRTESRIMYCGQCGTSGKMRVKD